MAAPSQGVSILGMEAALHARDKVGVQDFVLLEDFKSVTAFVENLKKRFQENLIYTYIGPVLISVNPYKSINIYNDSVIETYRNVNFYELPPHIYAVSDAAYRAMRREFHDQCVLISGESGSGKTEASKKILHYIATCNHQESNEIDRVKDRLLQSNPILEAFGNAKTNRNDNSSRFGKYMDVQFDFKGTPVGGVILNYLLEKSRVVKQATGERNFHIFYQLVEGASPEMRNALGISDDVTKYHYLNQGIQAADPSTINDKEDFATVCQALKTCDFSAEDQKDLFSVVAFVLLHGELTFNEDKENNATIALESLSAISNLVECEDSQLASALTNKSIMAEGVKVTSPLNLEQASYARDAFAKGVYERLFGWLVNKINRSLAKEKQQTKTRVLGLLDIYGFEIFDTNSFEQFCINYCNEKLQQLFITLTLKSEQDEYLNEGIEWEPVQYFNNKIICDLVDSKPTGIISILDEECLRPGATSDETFLEKLSSRLGGHPHFLSHASADVADRKNIKRHEFQLLHYAGEVTYSTEGFLDKNNDLLYRDLKELMLSTKNPITKQCFPDTELKNMKRPDTAGTQFKISLGQLMDILLSKQPSYIRCIKPNDNKQSNVFVNQIVRHQVKYLGLMENLRVRRAGFAYRRHYDNFLHRYKSLCPETWPFYKGPTKDGVSALCRHLQYTEEDYKMGRSKIFIRFPRVLFATEDALQLRKHDLATEIQAKFRGFFQQKAYQKMRSSVTRIAATWKMYCAKKIMCTRRDAARTIRRFINGFIQRKKPLCHENEMYVNHARYKFVLHLLDNLPNSVLDKSWPTCPDILQQASDDLRELNMRNIVRSYCIGLTTEKKTQLEQKVVAERLFKNKKSSYDQSIAVPFEDSRLNEEQRLHLTTKFSKTVKLTTEDILYSCMVTKYDRNGYRQRQRCLVITTESAYVLNEKNFKVKERISFNCLKGISTSALKDAVFILHVDSTQNNAKTKGDFVLSSDFLYEAIVKLVIAVQNDEILHIVSERCTHRMSSGKEGSVEFNTGAKSLVTRSKNKMLVIAGEEL